MKRIAVIVTLAFFLGACSSGSKRQITAPTTELAAPVTTSIDPTRVPATITIDYLNAVLARLDHVYGDIVREFVSRRDVTPAANVRLRAVYNDPLYREQLKIFSLALAQPFSNYRTPPGDPSTTVKHVLSASTSCVWLETNRDYSGVTVATEPIAPSQYLALRTKETTVDPTRVNPTAWEIAENMTYQTSTPPPANPCAPSL